MSDHPTHTASDDAPATDPEQSGERLDADKVPEEFPDRPRASLQHGTTVDEQRAGESLDGRLAQEEPDVDIATGDVPETTSTQLQSDLDEDGRDEEKDLVSERPVEEPHVDDSGQPHADPPAEEAAVHVIDADDVPGAVDRQAARPDPDQG